MLAVLAATAEQKQACVSAYDAAQQLRMDRKLKAAREKLAFCSRSECPPVVRNDCVQWMSEVIAALPSVVVGARDAEGHDLVSVRVTVDGERVAESLDGRALTLDPGVHTFKYERTDLAVTTEEKVVIREGEKNRVLAVTLAAKPAQAPVPVPVASAPPIVVEPPPPAAAAEHHASPVTWVLGAVGIVAGAAALGLDVKASVDATNLRNTCAPFCMQSDVDAARLKYDLAWVALGVGVAALAAAVIVFVASR
jgi:hypothetical protein